jgi:hypothetical protein
LTRALLDEHLTLIRNPYAVLDDHCRGAGPVRILILIGLI